MFKIAKTKAKHLCAAHGCKSNRDRSDTLCGKHRKRYQKETDPCRYVYNALKANARRRKKPFTLTLDDFREFCAETNYTELRGRRASAMSIDCMVQSLGYIKGNIRMITLGENASKGTADYTDEVPF